MSRGAPHHALAVHCDAAGDIAHVLLARARFVHAMVPSGLTTWYAT